MKHLICKMSNVSCFEAIQRQSIFSVNLINDFLISEKFNIHRCVMSIVLKNVFTSVLSAEIEKLTILRIRFFKI